MSIEAYSVYQHNVIPCDRCRTIRSACRWVRVAHKGSHATDLNEVVELCPKCTRELALELLDLADKLT